jgi:hypothetical protein
MISNIKLRQQQQRRQQKQDCQEEKRCQPQQVACDSLYSAGMPAISRVTSKIIRDASNGLAQR